MTTPFDHPHPAPDGPSEDLPLAPQPFDLTGPLPSAGTHILEASAGTGKTYAIAALAARYLADGLPLGELMMLTFSRLATQELRHRIRGRLTSTEAALERVLTGGDPGPDEIDRLLCDGHHEQLRVRLRRITGALADFDAAMIATFHEGAGRMLDGLGVLGSFDSTATHIEDAGELAREVAADFWLRAFADVDSPEFTWSEAQTIADHVATFDGPLAPDPAHLPTFGRRFSFAQAVRRELARRKAARGLFTYDDLLTRLRDLLAGRLAPDAAPDPALAEAVRHRLRQRFRVVLVDEFQDTDPVQWEILESAFRDHSTLIVIGDPKQAIYGFRGADVNAYLTAVSSPGARQHTLDTNWRTDSGLIDALYSVFGGAQLGDPRITVRPVRARHRKDRLRTEDRELQAPLRLRVLPILRDRRRGPTITQLRDQIRTDLVEDVTRLLASDAELCLQDGQARPVSPRDIAILVNLNQRAEDIRAALTAKGIPAVHSGATSVFGTPAAQDWLTLLRACETPRSQTIREVALTSFVGWTFVELVSADDQDLADLSARIRSWARTLQWNGVAGLIEAVLGAGLAERLLAQAGGDRKLTDLRHLGELLHTAQSRNRLGITALLDWLDDQITSRSGSTERTRRMESDADAVQIMTLHQAKGLEFPIVYLPDQWDQFRPDSGQGPFTFHHNGERHLYLAPNGADRRRAWAVHETEEAGESLRKFYVAATRAQCRVVAWWASHSSNTAASPLHRLLFRAGAPEPRGAYPIDTSPDELLQAPGVLVQSIGNVLLPEHEPLAGSLPELRARTFPRTLDDDWRRTSYSGLTARAHDLALLDPGATTIPVAPEGREDDELQVVTDESMDDDVATSTPSPSGALATPSPMAQLPRGAAFGTLVHAIYETFDPQADDLAGEVRAHAGRWLTRLPLGTRQGGDSPPGLSAETLTSALLPAMQTSLGPIADDRRLCDLAASDRLAELDFEYALDGGDDPGSVRVLLRDVARLLEDHVAPGDLLHDYPSRLTDPLLADEVLRGYLVGSIDAVLRISDPEDPGPSRARYLVVDYKTNWLGPLEEGAPLTVGHYTPKAMAEAMMTAHYPLQALLYSVALHRFLRWRLPGYVPSEHLGGVAYLFVRGMAGPDTPVIDGMPCGVFSWRPPAALITALSDLLAGDPRETT